MPDYRATALALAAKAGPGDNAAAALVYAVLELAQAVRDQTDTLVDFMGNSGVRTVEL